MRLRLGGKATASFQISWSKVVVKYDAVYVKLTFFSGDCAWNFPQINPVAFGERNSKTWNFSFRWPYNLLLRYALLAYASLLWISAVKWWTFYNFRCSIWQIASYPTARINDESSPDSIFMHKILPDIKLSSRNTVASQIRAPSIKKSAATKIRRNFAHSLCATQNWDDTILRAI